MSINSLFREIYKQDIAIALFDGNGDVIPVQVTDNTGASVFLDPLLAKDIKVSKVIFDGDFGIVEGDSIEDALVALKQMIGDYEYTLPTLYDTDIIGSDDTNNDLGLAVGSDQNVINKYLFGLIDSFSIPNIPSTDAEISTVSATNVALGLVNGSNVSDALISLNTDIQSLTTPRDINIDIDDITKTSIPAFTGTTQSDMNIYLSNNSGLGGGLWEQVTGTSYIKPSILSGQVDKTSLMMDSKPIYFKDNTDISIGVSGSYDALAMKVKDIRMAMSSDPGGNNIYLNTDNVYDKGLEMKLGVSGTSESYVLGNSTNKLRITDNYDGYASAIDMTIFDNGGVVMNTTLTNTNIEIKNSTKNGLTLNNDKATNVSTTTLYNNDSYLKMGSTYGSVELYRSWNQYLQMNGGTPGAAANTELRFSSSTYLNFTDDSVELYLGSGSYLDITNDNVRLHRTSNSFLDIGDTLTHLSHDTDIGIYFYDDKSEWSTGNGDTIESSSVVDGLRFSTSGTGRITMFTDIVEFIGTEVIRMPDLPTVDPVNAGQLWNDNGTLKIS